MERALTGLSVTNEDRSVRHDCIYNCFGTDSLAGAITRCCDIEANLAVVDVDT